MTLQVHVGGEYLAAGDAARHQLVRGVVCPNVSPQRLGCRENADKQEASLY
jgi:hypothetical protein